MGEQMALRCDCGNDRAHRVQIRYDKDGTRFQCCDRCGNLGSTTNPDVYWPGHPYESENIVDVSGTPILLRSKGHKAAVMKEQNLSEIGDPVHGSRQNVAGSLRFKRDKVKERRYVKESILKAVESMKRKYGRLHGSFL